MDRRTFLGRSGAAALGLAGAPLWVGWLACGPSSLREALGGFFVDREAAHAVGREYLKRFPDARVPELVEEIAGEQGAAWDRLAVEDPKALAAALRARHREDFAAGRTASVRGWLLSATEARLCALAALLAGATAEEDPGPDLL